MNDPAALLQNAVFQYLVSTKQYASASELYKEARLDRFYASPLAELLQIPQWTESNNLLISIWNNYIASRTEIHTLNPAPAPIPIQVTIPAPTPVTAPSPPIPIPIPNTNPLPTQQLIDSPTSSPTISSSSHDIPNRYHTHKPQYHSPTLQHSHSHAHQPHAHTHAHTHTHSPGHGHGHGHAHNHGHGHVHGHVHGHAHGHGHGHGHGHVHGHSHVHTLDQSHNKRDSSPLSSPDTLNHNVTNLSLTTQPTTLLHSSTTAVPTDHVSTEVMTFNAENITLQPPTMLSASTTDTFFQLASSPGTLSSALQSISPISVGSMMSEVQPMVDSLMQDQASVGTPPDESGIGRFPCHHPGCNKSFSTSAILKRHIKEHSGERPFSCNVDGCTKRFARKYDLKVHMRSHTGEKPYSCTFPGCERKFSRSSDLRLHERIHKGDKPFICDCEGCKKRFVRYADLKKHKRTHEVHEGSHPHKHGAGCGHTAIAHEDHIDYLHDAHLHNNHHDHIDDHTIAVTANNPDGCKPTFVCGHHQHDESCGHELVPHFDHFDFLVDGRLHYVHDSHCDDHGWIDVIDWNPLPEDKNGGGGAKEGEAMVHVHDSS